MRRFIITGAPGAGKTAIIRRHLVTLLLARWQTRHRCGRRIARTCIATGPEGSDRSLDGGQTWTALDKPGYHTLTIAGPVIYASGSDGRLDPLFP
jgi:hypothetical protein